MLKFDDITITQGNSRGYQGGNEGIMRAIKQSIFWRELKKNNKT